ncbi:MAG: putative glycoside hydrolase, partial [Patescibacteria group bacterium]
PQCSDGIDNDSDGQIDHPNDPDCTSASDDSEAGTLPPACPYNTCASSQTCANWHNQSILCCVTACQDPAPAPPPTPTDDPISRACFDATLGPCYPRRSFFHFGNAPAEWYAKFDLVGNSTSGARAAKSINPAVYIINTGVDWNVEADKDNKSDDWNLKGINGDSLIIPGGGYSRPQSDITMSCPVIGSARYNEYVAGETADLLCSSCDGVLNQGSWGKPLGSTSNFNNSKDTTGIDMDRSCITNGGTVPVSSCNDWYEHNEAWMRQTWQEGIKFTIDSVRTAIGPNKILINNTGGIRPDEFPYINNYFSQMNGEFQEHIQSISSFTYLKNAMDTWRSQGREPHTNILGANPSGDKDNFSYVRFFMGISLIGETYFESGADNNHHYVHYYDELDVNLGYPVEEAEQIKNTGQNGRGVWVRFFDNGVVILNADENSNTVSDSDIQNLDGYAGPYYRFKGGQDATRNNGEQFSSITLNGSLASTSGSNRLYVGDSVLLVKNPTTMVTDIIIDDSEFNTSPGSEPAQLSAQWKFHICPAGGLNMPCSCDLTEKYWSQNCRSWQNLFGLSWNTSRAGTAVFTPTINVPGDYAVYEWHGKVKNQIMASNVSYIVNYAGGGSQTFTINQENNAGQWNKLGVFNLAVGTGNNVTVNASGADETVVADAIRFVYQGNTGDIKGPPGNYISTYLKADFNCDNKVNLTDFGILLSNWGTPAKMNNYKNASCSQEMSLDLRVDSRINNLDLAILLSCWGMPVEANQPDCFGN